MCFSAIFSCLGSACIGCCCSSLSDCKVKHGPGSRIPYIFLMFLCCIFAVVMGLYGDEVLYENSFFDYQLVICDPAANEACEPNGSVYRTSFTLFLFFLVHAIVVKMVASFHWLFFTFKLLSVIAVLGLSYLIPNSFFDGYAQFAMYGSLVFLLLQVVVLINWAWDVSERIVGKYNELNASNDEEEDNFTKAGLCCVQFGLIAATLVIYAIIITGFVFFFIWFTPATTCEFNSAMLIVSIILILITTVVPILFGTGSIFTSAVVCFYMSFLVYAALEGTPDTTCNILAQDNSTTTMWVGIIITAAAISYTGFSVSKNGQLLDDRHKSDEINMDLETAATKNKKNQEGDDAGTSNYDENADLGTSNYDDAEEKNDRRKPDLPEDKLKIDQKANVLFHSCMAFSSIYMAMLYTNWGTNSIDSHGRSMVSVWINIAAQWITFVIYAWTYSAAKICPDRFGQEVDDE